MKKNFITGLALLVPTGLTFIILSFIVNLLTAPFMYILIKLLNYYTPSQDSFFFDNYEFALMVSKLLILIRHVSSPLAQGPF